MSGTEHLPTTVRGRRTRAAILGAAEEVFGTIGYDRGSISEITRRAGIAQGTFYIYFPDKLAVFVELVRELGHGLRSHIRSALEGVSGRLEAEEAGLRAFFEFVKEHRSVYRIVRQAEFVDVDTYRDYYHKMADGYVRGLSQAMERGEIRRMDPERLAYFLMGIGDFMGMRWVLWEENADLDALLADAMDFIRHGMAAAEASAASNGASNGRKKRS